MWKIKLKHGLFISFAVDFIILEIARVKVTSDGKGGCGAQDGNTLKGETLRCSCAALLVSSPVRYLVSLHNGGQRG